MAPRNVGLVDSRVPHGAPTTGEQPTRQPYPPPPPLAWSTAPPISPAPDALASTTTSIRTGNPSIRNLHADCTALIRSLPLSALKHDVILKLVSILTGDEISREMRAVHGVDAMSSGWLWSSRVKSAKGSVAKARGVGRDQVVRELEKNQEMSGVLQRRDKLRRQRISASALSRFWGPMMEEEVVGDDESEKDDDDDDEAAEVVQNGGVGVSSTMKLTSAGDVGRKTNTDVPNSDFEGRVVAGAAVGTNLSWQWLLPPRKGPLEAFDPTPHGQPYAGTNLYQPGFREDGSVTRRKLLRQRPGPQRWIDRAEGVMAADESVR